MDSPTLTPRSARNAHHSSSTSVALVWMWCSTPWNAAISAARWSRPAASGSPPCHTTENRGTACAHSLTEAATAPATSTGIRLSCARNGR